LYYFTHRWGNSSTSTARICTGERFFLRVVNSGTVFSIEITDGENVIELKTKHYETGVAKFSGER